MCMVFFLVLLSRNTFTMQEFLMMRTEVPINSFDLIFHCCTSWVRF